MANRLAHETSPYLLQHKDNPVDWWPWSEKAFTEARRRNVPVLLSVGYAACHWCHVMAHESFEDEATAALMNELFVNVKVDREERPDVDAVYMDATQALTGHGGWPMTVFMTPDGDPFVCGTYFPPEPRHGMPAFRQVLQAVADAWRDRHEDVVASGREITRRLSERETFATGERPPTAADLDQAERALALTYDAERGGFGGAPKFPPSMCLEFLLRHYARTGNERSLAMVAGTCEAMARGGMYDQLAGGFARYSVDAGWVVPHFEKMLYDNALLLRAYTHWWRETGDPLAARIANETADFLLRDLRTPEGGFASALDADSEGEEGRYYVWTPGELAKVLGDDGAWAAEVWGVTESGTFEHGSSVLQLRADPDDWDRYERIRATLLAARAERVPPGLDDKVVTAWNGLAIGALADAGAVLRRPELVEAAGRAAGLMRDLHWTGDRLLRTSRLGTAGRNAGVLEDYADLADGLLALYSVTGDARHVDWAGELLDVVLMRFGADNGGFYDTADDAEALVRRPQDPTDNATPAGSSAAAGALLSYAALSGSDRHRTAAERALAAITPLLSRHARFVGHAAAVAEALVAGPAEVAVIGDSDELLRAAWLATSPGAVVAFGAGDVPLLRDRPLVGGRAAAYVCRGFACSAPVTEPAALRELVGGRAESL
ncbi:MAG TPA: thioredoxin domain-containing protein [Frankiaceae bacterium]|nr:thioredoxin domain-containing protein [Frankiaceae bacterium]